MLASVIKERENGVSDHATRLINDSNGESQQNRRFYLEWQQQQQQQQQQQNLQPHHHHHHYQEQPPQQQRQRQHIQEKKIFLKEKEGIKLLLHKQQNQCKVEVVDQNGQSQNKNHCVD
eukprot:Pgem_evm1s12571